MIGKLLADGFSRIGPAAQALSDPISDTPMQVTLDELRPYELDPRVIRNPLYDEIKASIRERGLDAAPPITRRPGADHYIIRNGGNTRLAILRDLWTETKDEQFFRINCLFRPWPQRGEIIALTGHLAENELHGGLTFIERALGVEKARELYEQEQKSDSQLSQSELARRLAADGYPVPQSHISRMQDTVRYLLPAIPNVLYGGLGRHQAERLAVLRKSTELVWHQRTTGKNPPASFEDIFQDVLASFDSQPDTFNTRRVQDELVGRIAELLAVDYNSLELDIDQIERRQRTVISPPDIKPAGLPIATPTTLAPIPGFTGSSSTGAEPSPSPVSVKMRPNIDEPPRVPGFDAVAAPMPRAASPTPPNNANSDDARLHAHIVSPATSTERLQAIQQMVANHTGERNPDFADAALRAIPVQVGSLFPITDVWYIEEALDTPDRLRIHIAQFACEVAEEAGVAHMIQPAQDDIGFSCLQGDADAEPHSATGHAVITLLRALTTSPTRKMQESGTPERRLEALLGWLLVGAGTDHIRGGTRLSDDSLVKLFRILRLARRLIDLDAGTSDQASH